MMWQVKESEMCNMLSFTKMLIIRNMFLAARNATFWR